MRHVGAVWLSKVLGVLSSSWRALVRFCALVCAPLVTLFYVVLALGAVLYIMAFLSWVALASMMRDATGRTDKR